MVVAPVLAFDASLGLYDHGEVLVVLGGYMVSVHILGFLQDVVAELLDV